jgi:hypothetical protein
VRLGQRRPVYLIRELELWLQAGAPNRAVWQAHRDAALRSLIYLGPRNQIKLIRMRLFIFVKMMHRPGTKTCYALWHRSALSDVNATIFVVILVRRRTREGKKGTETSF